MQILIYELGLINLPFESMPINRYIFIQIIMSIQILHIIVKFLHIIHQ